MRLGRSCHDPAINPSRSTKACSGRRCAPQLMLSVKMSGMRGSRRPVPLQIERFACRDVGTVPAYTLPDRRDMLRGDSNPARELRRLDDFEHSVQMQSGLRRLKIRLPNDCSCSISGSPLDTISCQAFAAASRDSALGRERYYCQVQIPEDISIDVAGIYCTIEVSEMMAPVHIVCTHGAVFLHDNSQDVQASAGGPIVASNCSHLHLSSNLGIDIALSPAQVNGSLQAVSNGDIRLAFWQGAICSSRIGVFLSSPEQLVRSSSCDVQIRTFEEFEHLSSKDLPPLALAAQSGFVLIQNL